LKTVLEPV